MGKNGIEKFILKSLRPGRWLFLLLNSLKKYQNRKFSERNWTHCDFLGHFVKDLPFPYKFPQLWFYAVVGIDSSILSACVYVRFEFQVGHSHCKYLSSPWLTGICFTQNLLTWLFKKIPSPHLTSAYYEIWIKWKNEALVNLADTKYG